MNDSAKNKGRKGTQHDLEATGPDQIRNVVLVGPSASGKTTLVEALAAHTGAIPRAGSVEDGSTVSDHDPSEQAHHRSLQLAVVPIIEPGSGTKINLIDTPGYADFVGEVRAGLRAADCALFVVSAADSIDHATSAVWAECERVGMPRALVISKLDHARADYEATLAAAQASFGGRILPVESRHGDAVTGLLGANTPSADADARGELIEGVIEESEDEALMESYLEGEEISEQELLADLEKAIAGAHFHPVLQVSAVDGTGLPELLEVIVRGFPAPASHPSPEVFTTTGAPADPITCDPQASLVAEVIKTASDPYLGRVSLVRVFSGSLNADDKLHVSGHFESFFGDAGHPDHDDEEKVGGLSLPFGKHHQPVKQVIAGDIAAISRLSVAETGDTLSSIDAPVVLKPWDMPDAMLPTAIEAASKADDDKLSGALTRLSAEDPSLRIEHNAETGQLVLWTLGESHTDMALERLRDHFAVEVKTVEVIVPLRETLSGKGAAQGRHVKQSGGHGQYAVCDIEVEPLEQGAGFEFVDKVVGGAVPRQFILSVEKGLHAQMARGCRYGYPMVDVRATLLDGKTHSVDSSDMAFQTAGGLALREAAEKAGVTMLEPYDEVSVTVPDDLVGGVMSDLSSRRGRLLGSEVGTPGYTVVKAHVPQTELLRYAIDLRSQTHGAGTFTREFAHYEAMTEEQARAVTPKS